MLKRNAIVVVLALGFVLGYGTLAFTQDKAKGPRGPHPARQLQAAMHSLEQARRHLERADGDFGGHRPKALDLIKQAEGEVKQAVELAKASAPPPAAKPATGTTTAPAATAPATTSPAPATTPPAATTTAPKK